MLMVLREVDELKLEVCLNVECGWMNDDDLFGDGSKLIAVDGRL